MTLLWLITGAALVVAVVAWSQARRTAKRLEQLSQLYWELKYQHGELRVQLQKSPLPPADGSHAAPAAPQPPAQSSFIPLTSLKR